MRNGNKLLSQILSLSLTLAVLGQSVALSANGTLTGDVRITVTPANIHEASSVPGANRTVNMSFHGVSIPDALRALAKKGGFNVLIDESVQGEVSLDLNNVTVQDALEALKNHANLAYSLEGKNLMVAGADSDKGRSFSRSVTKIIPLRYANARMISQLLNSTVFSDPNGAAAAGAAGPAGPVTADFHTNSLVVVGSPTDIRTVLEHVEALDQPREMKTWRLNNSNVLDVATILASSLFNEGQASFSAGTVAGAASGPSPSSMRAVAENIQEGAGSAQSQGGGSGASASVGPSGLTLRVKVKADQTVQISPNGPLLLPDTRLNTLTLMGTAEQIAMAESMISTLDRKLPQVVLETSLVELREVDRKELGHSVAAQKHTLVLAGNNDPAAISPQNRLPAPLSAIPSDVAGGGLITQAFENVLGFGSFRGQGFFQNRFAYQINALVKQEKGKILANPSMLMTSDTEGVISIVDEIIRSVSITQGQAGSPPQLTTVIGEAGIVLSLLPKVGADGTINLRIRPSVSTVADQRISNGNVVTLLSRREVVSQSVTMRDGETFVLGGLINDTNSKIVRRDPVLSKLPIVGALARNSSTDKSRTELVVMITAHIVNDESETARATKASPMQPAILSKRPPSQTDQTIIPVSASGWNQVGGKVLPPLQSPNVIGGPEGDDTPGVRIEPTSELTPQPLNPDELKPATALMRLKPNQAGQNAMKTTAITPIETVTNLKEKTAAPPPKKPVVTAPKGLEDVNDNTIREIMEKFK